MGHLLLDIPDGLYRLWRSLGLASPFRGCCGPLRQPVRPFSPPCPRADPSHAAFPALLSSSSSPSPLFTSGALCVSVSASASSGRCTSSTASCWKSPRFVLSLAPSFALTPQEQNDIQTIPWHALVSSLSTLRASHPSALSSSSHPSPPRLDAHDVANRIMREENYLIALFNKDVLDLSIPVPEAVLRWAPRLAGTGAGMLTRTLEWNLSFCLTGFLFGRDGQVRRAFVSERNRKELVEA